MGTNRPPLTAGIPDRKILLPRIPRRVLLWALPVAFLAVFFYIPLATILQTGARSALESGLGGYSLTRAANVFGFTLWQAILSTLLTLAVGLPGAYLLSRVDFPLRGVLRAVSAVPFILPTVVVAAGFESLLGPVGWINLVLQRLGIAAQPIPFLHSLAAILVAHVFYNTSIVLRLVGNAWNRLDDRLPDAARTLGAGHWQAFRQVTLPLLWPSILAAAALVFLFDVTSFGVILILGGPAFSTLEVEIYRQTLERLNLAAAAFLSALQLISTLVFIILSDRLAGRAEHNLSRVSMNAGTRPTSWAAKILTGLGAGAMFLFFLLPLLSPVAGSLITLEPARGQLGSWQPAVTLTYYRELFFNRSGSAFFATPIQTAGNSLLVAAATTVLALFIGVPVAAALSRPTFFERILEPVFLLPLGTSAVTLGLGMLLVFASPPLLLIRSPLLLPIAHSLVAVPFVIRSLRPALAGIPRRLIEAARTLGASPLRSWWSVEMPVVFRALASAAGFAFAISLGEFGATSLIVRPDFPTMPVEIYRLLSLPGGLNYGQAMAMATMLMLMCGLAIAVIERFRDPTAEKSVVPVVLPARLPSGEIDA